MSKTVVGLFNSMSDAERVKQDLISDGYESGDINVMANDSASSTSDSTYTSSDNRSNDTGIGAKIEHFFSSLMGGDNETHEHYATGVNGGGALLAVRTEDDEAEEVAQWLHDHGASNIDRNAGSVAGSGSGYRDGADTTRRDAYADTTGDRASQSIPVIEEELQVGKRMVNRGGVRVYSHVTETPAEADVTLRDETINVERRAVNRPATAEDFAAGSGNSIEMRAQGEEAVVGKTARVIEEVVLGKQVSEHTQSVRDNVRKTDVEVENLDGNRDEEAEYAGATKNNRM